MSVFCRSSSSPSVRATTYVTRCFWMKPTWNFLKNSSNQFDLDIQSKTVQSVNTLSKNMENCACPICAGPFLRQI